MIRDWAGSRRGFEQEAAFYQRRSFLPTLLLLSLDHDNLLCHLWKCILIKMKKSPKILNVVFYQKRFLLPTLLLLFLDDVIHQLCHLYLEDLKNLPKYTILRTKYTFSSMKHLFIKEAPSSSLLYFSFLLTMSFVNPEWWSVVSSLKLCLEDQHLKDLPK